MSPLVRSLLALAALLAAADAQYYEYYNCVTKIIGRTSSHEKPLAPVDLDNGESYIEIKDYCDAPMNLVGEKITVCNKTPGWRQPDVTPPPYPALTPVDVRCYDPSGCTAFTIEYCD